MCQQKSIYHIDFEGVVSLFSENNELQLNENIIIELYLLILETLLYAIFTHFSLSVLFFLLLSNTVGQVTFRKRKMSRFDRLNIAGYSQWKDCHLLFFLYKQNHVDNQMFQLLWNFLIMVFFNKGKKKKNTFFENSPTRNKYICIFFSTNNIH